jgi:glycerate kinase
MMAFLGAALHPRFNVVMQYLKFEMLLRQADLVITAEGSLDADSRYGKVPCEVARYAKERGGFRSSALAGTIGKDAADTLKDGIDAFASIIDHPCHPRRGYRRRCKVVSEYYSECVANGLRGYSDKR